MREARVDLLEPIDLIEQKSSEEILAEIGADAEISNLSPSDPAGRVALGWTIREQRRRAEENRNVKSNLLAFATGADLDFIGETYYRNSDGSKIKRKEGESDDSYRLALQESPEGLTSAGTLKSYNFHASRAHELIDRESVSSHSPEPMEMNTYFIMEDDSKVDEVKAKIESYLVPFIPGGDKFTVLRATKKEFSLTTTVKVERGVVLDLVKSQGEQKLDEYFAKAKRIGGIVSFSSISEALTLPGVVQVKLPDPWSDIVCQPSEYPSLTSVNLTYEYA